MDVGYNGLKQNLEMSQKAFENAHWLHCAICREGLPASGAMSLVCLKEGCNGLTHIECLSATFLKNSSAETVVPTSGSCPSCGTKLQWVDLVRELSLRMRGEKEIAAVFKKRRVTKKQAQAGAADDESEVSADDQDMDDVMPGEDEWHELPESSDIEIDEPHIRSDPSPAFKSKALKRKAPAIPYSEPVIEDSDWDEAEILS